MRKVSLLAALAIMIGVAGVSFSQETKASSSATVSASAVCTAIADRMPEGTAAEFSKDTPKIYYWTRIDGAEGTDVKHIWYAGETIIGEISLKVTTASFRTWSSKTVYPGLEGDMSVEVVDAAGNVLKKDTFKIK